LNNRCLKQKGFIIEYFVGWWNPDWGMEKWK